MVMPEVWMRLQPATVALVLIGAIAGSVAAQTSAPATRPVTNWFALSPQQFAETDAAKQELPWEGVDDLLLSAAILHQTNVHRAEHDLPPLRHMPRVDEAAIMHAEDMAAGGWFSHVNEHDPKKRDLVDRVKLLKLNPMFAGENIIMEYGIRYEPKRRVYDTSRGGRPGLSYTANGPPIPRHTYQSFAEQVVRRWMDSPPHRENMLTSHARFLGSAARAGKSEDEMRFQKFYAVQVFFTPMPGR